MTYAHALARAPKTPALWTLPPSDPKNSSIAVKKIITKEEALAHILPCIPPTASRKSQAVYEEFYRGMGFPRAPNFILTQGHSPNVARASWEAVKNILVEGEIARWVKELMFVA